MNDMDINSNSCPVYHPDFCATQKMVPTKDFRPSVVLYRSQVDTQLMAQLDNIGYFFLLFYYIIPCIHLQF